MKDAASESRSSPSTRHGLEAWTAKGRCLLRGAGPCCPSPGDGVAYFWRSLYFSMSSFWMLAGTSPYLANSIVYSALPWVAERSSVE